MFFNTGKPIAYKDAIETIKNIGLVVLFVLIFVVVGIILKHGTLTKPVVSADRTYCVGGYKFVMMGDWTNRQDPQLINEQGGGVSCQ